MGHDILVFSTQALYSMQTPNAVTRHCQVNETQESSGNSKEHPPPRELYTVVSRFSVSRFSGLSRFSELNASDGAWSHHKSTISI